jgi:hypothetical protein
MQRILNVQNGKILYLQFLSLYGVQVKIPEHLWTCPLSIHALSRGDLWKRYGSRNLSWI